MADEEYYEDEEEGSTEEFEPDEEHYEEPDDECGDADGEVLEDRDVDGYSDFRCSGTQSVEECNDCNGRNADLDNRNDRNDEDNQFVCVVDSPEEYDEGISQGYSFNVASSLQSVLGSFVNQDVSGLLSEIGNTIHSGGLTNLMVSGGLREMLENAVSSASHRFLGINPETGKIIGAVAGNIVFRMGGRDNLLGGVGKIILDNILSGKYKRQVKPYVSPVPGLPSLALDFYDERDKCLRNKTLFEDPEFPATEESLVFKSSLPYGVEWLRPGEIVSQPQLIIEGHSRFDVIQGELGDCWLLAAVANLTLRDELFYRVVPPDQSFTENYAGIFHFQFWRYGTWCDVVIDDRLPTKNGKLLYMHSAEHCEFWSALLEKAYAKLYGSYEALVGGSTAEALEDFTGGLIENYDLQNCPTTAALALLIRGFQMGSMFGCSIEGDPRIREHVMPNGLVRGHAYSITSIQKVEVPDGDKAIIRLRNPWGGDTEWNGAWSDNASEWYYVSDEQKAEMKVVFAQDGEFWMSFDDFMNEFMQLEVCNLGADVMDEVSKMTGVSYSPADAWQNYTADGKWSVENGTAGGCRNFIRTFADNPQYLINVEPNESTVEHDGKCTIIIAVMQKYRRELRSQGLKTLPIGFAVYRCSSLYAKVGRDFFESEKEFASTHTFTNRREVITRFRGPPGNYLLVPSTFDPDSEAEFLLRVFANAPINARELQ